MPRGWGNVVFFYLFFFAFCRTVSLSGTNHQNHILMGNEPVTSACEAEAIAKSYQDDYQGLHFLNLGSNSFGL